MTVLAASWRSLRGRVSDGIWSIITADPTQAEFYSTAPAVIWAALLLPPWWCTTCSPTYAAMRWLPEGVWGLLFLSYACVGFAAWWCRSYRWRRAATLAGVLIWLVVLGVVVQARPVTTGYVYAVFALIACIAHLQIRGLDRGRRA